MTAQQIETAAKHALYLQESYSLEEALTYLKQNFSQGQPGRFFESDYAKVQAKWNDLIRPGSAYGESSRRNSAQREQK